MDQSAKKWMYKTASKNYWRIAAWYEFEDLIQDGYWHYYRVVNRYKDIKNPPHIMALFKTTFTNHIHDLSKKRTKQIDDPVCNFVSDNMPEESIWERMGSIGTELTAFGVALSELPKPVCDVLRLLTTDSGRRSLRSQLRVRIYGKNETLNERLCHKCGYDPATVNLVDAVRAFLSDPAAV